MSQPDVDRRQARRGRLTDSRRRYPRIQLDVDWFLSSEGCSTLGRGLEVSLRGAWIPLPCTARLAGQTRLHLALPSRPRLFQARGVAAPGWENRGWVIRFTEVSDEDLRLLAYTLIEEYGLAAVPNLERKFGRYSSIPARYLRTST